MCSSRGRVRFGGLEGEARAPVGSCPPMANTQRSGSDLGDGTTDSSWLSVCSELIWVDEMIE